MSHEERAAGVRRRVAEEQRRRRRRRDRGTVLAAAAACLALIAGIGFAMPGFAGQGGDLAAPADTASMFGGSEAMGYIVIGVLAFLLGAGVTVLAARHRNARSPSLASVYCSISKNTALEIHPNSDT